MVLSRPTPSSLLRTLLGGLLALLAACSTIEVSESVGGLERTTDRTWAWSVRSPADEPLDGEVRAAVEARLAELGWERVESPQAALLVDYRTKIEREKRNRDPFFSMYTADELEWGTLTIEVRDASTGEPVWTASARSRLRRSAVTIGPFATDLTPTDDPRDWRTQERVSAILGRL